MDLVASAFRRKAAILRRSLAVVLVCSATWIGSAQSARLDDAALANAWRSGQWATYGNDLVAFDYDYGVFDWGAT